MINRSMASILLEQEGQNPLNLHVLVCTGWAGSSPSIAYTVVKTSVLFCVCKCLVFLCVHFGLNTLKWKFSLLLICLNMTVLLPPLCLCTVPGALYEVIRL